MTRFLHMADVQLGMRARDATEVGGRLREARFTTLGRCVELAASEGVDFVVIAGDLFESNQVGAHTVSRAVQILQGAHPIPVHILPGNHDRLDAGSVYERPEFAPAAARNIVVLRAREPVEVGGRCVLYPCPLTRRRDLADPTDWIPGRGHDGLIRIGVAHGSLPIANRRREFPIEIDTPQRKGLDYLALGDWHDLNIHASGRLAYPGAPERTGFGEGRAGHVLVVEIAGPGHPPRLTPHGVATLEWLRWEEKLRDGADGALSRLRERIEGLPDGPNTLLRLTLTGAVGAHELPLVDRFETWLRARRDNGRLLHFELHAQLHTTEALEEALLDLAGSDAVIAGALADLRAMADADAGRARGGAGVGPRPMDELIDVWVRGGGGDRRMGEVARGAIRLLAMLTGEVN